MRAGAGGRPEGRRFFDLSVSARPGGSEEAGGREKTKTGKQGPGGGPGPQGSSGLVPRWGEGGGRDGSVGRPDGRRAPSVGLTNGAVGAVGVGCTVAWAAKMHALSLVLRGFGYEIAPAARCFCFLNRGPGPSDGAGGGALAERSKTLRPATTVCVATMSCMSGLRRMPPKDAEMLGVRMSSCWSVFRGAFSIVERTLRVHLHTPK